MSRIQRQWLHAWAELEGRPQREVAEQYGVPSDEECADMLGPDLEPEVGT